MYLRTVRRKNKDGSEVAYHQLAHDVRRPDGAAVAAEVEETVFFKTANLFNLAVDLVFLDSTPCSVMDARPCVVSGERVDLWVRFGVVEDLFPALLSREGSGGSAATKEGSLKTLSRW